MDDGVSFPSLLFSSLLFSSLHLSTIGNHPIVSCPVLFSSAQSCPTLLCSRPLISTSVKANVTIKPDEGQLYCEISNTTTSATAIAPLVNATCDEDPSVTMMLLPDVDGQGITFAVYWRESSHITLYGSHTIGGDQWGQIATDGEPQMTSYNGTTDFAMPVDTAITNG